MSLKRSKSSKWVEADYSIAHGSLSTAETYPLSRHHVPVAMRCEPFSGGWLKPISRAVIDSTNDLSTGNAQFQVLMERNHPFAPPDDRFRYQSYLIAQVTDGRCFQIGPDNDVKPDFGVRHHEPQRDPSLGAIYGASTSSTGW